MDKFNLLIIPIVGGYVFLITFKLTRFYHQKIEKQRLLFHSILVGGVIGFLSLHLKEILDSHRLTEVIRFLKIPIPSSLHGLGIYFYIIVISCFIPLVLNVLLSLIFGEAKVMSYIIKKWGDSYERLFWDSYPDSSDKKQKPVMLTTKNGKVYIGYISEVSSPLSNSHVTIIPSISGYRDRDTQTVIITTDYTGTIKKYIIDNGKNLDIVGITIPVSEIILASKFSAKLFKKFNATVDDKPQNA
jgi:hypothetical protein